MSSSSLPTKGKSQRVSLKEIKEATENFDQRYALGHGGEAKVYSAQLMLHTQVAVKHLNPNSSGFEDEIRIMPKIQHPNIVSLLGYCNDSGQKILIYEYMANGSLADYIQKEPKPTAASSTTVSLFWEQRLKICLGAAHGLKHLHAETKEFAKGIIHRDVNPNNILLDANWVAKISDFGMFKLAPADQIGSTMPTMIKGTSGYYAPEYLNYQHVTRKIDVYAFEVVLFQVLCRKMPWDREGESYYRKEDEDLGQWARQNVDSKIRGEISNYCLNAFTEIIQKSLSVDPKKRPTMNEVVLTLHNALELQLRRDLDAAIEAMGSSKLIHNFKYESYTIKEVNKHNKKGDCWIIIRQLVYDVTSIIDIHPGGGEVILKAAGKDATTDFETTGHSYIAKDMLKLCCVGAIDSFVQDTKRKMLLQHARRAGYTRK